MNSSAEQALFFCSALYLQVATRDEGGRMFHVANIRIVFADPRPGALAQIRFRRLDDPIVLPADQRGNQSGAEPRGPRIARPAPARPRMRRPRDAAGRLAPGRTQTRSGTPPWTRAERASAGFRFRQIQNAIPLLSQPRVLPTTGGKLEFRFDELNSSTGNTHFQPSSCKTPPAATA